MPNTTMPIPTPPPTMPRWVLELSRAELREMLAGRGYGAVPVFATRGRMIEVIRQDDLGIVTQWWYAEEDGR